MKSGGVLLLACVMTFAAGAPVRLTAVTGGHPHDLTFYSVFEGNSDWNVTLDGHPSAFKRDITREADVLVLYDLADVNEEARRENLKKFVAAGKGIVVLHHAIADNQTWPWWYEEVVGGKYLLRDEGGQRGSTYKHDQDMKIQVAEPHAVTKGMATFEINDEAYKYMWMSPKNRVLLTTDHPLSDKAVAWIGPCATSRVVVIQLGHGPLAHNNAAYRKLVRQAVDWAAGRTN